MKLPPLFPVALFAGGIPLSIELKPFDSLCPRVCIFAAFLLLLMGSFTLRQNWITSAALFAAGAWLSPRMAVSNLECTSIALIATVRDRRAPMAARYA
jgi:hypothetical protein